MINNLEKLGFSSNEAKVYLALLEIGDSPSGAIIKRTGMHRNIVYEALDNMVKRQLVSEAIKTGKKHFKVTNPQLLVSQAQETLELASEVVKQIQANIETIAPEVFVYEGSAGWQTAYRRQMKRLKSGDTVQTLGAGADKWVMAMGETFVKWENFINKNKVANPIVAYEWQRQEIIQNQTQIMRTTKYLNQDNQIPANTEIFTDRVFLQIYSEPVVLIEVKSQEVADGYRQHFETLWNIAKE
jgi:HTH-type transcriptional regulator, sugar sensing transcriptional regulator